jgi:ADP-ribose pyrophosphatase
MVFETLNHRLLYQGRVFSVWQDEVRLPDGNHATIDVVKHTGAITLVPIDRDGQIWFIRQYRHPANRVLLELPAGMMEVGEHPETTAAREIREEIGMSADLLEKIGEFYLAPGYSDEYMYVYLATGLQPSPLDPDADEFLTIEKMSYEEAIKMAEAGQIQDAKTLAALFLARAYLVKID